MTAASVATATRDPIDRILSRLACPACRGTLRRDGSRLTCSSCSRAFEIRNGVPILLHEESAAMIEGARGQAENVAIRQKLGRSGVLRLAEVLRPPHPFTFMRWKVSRAQRAAFSRIVAQQGHAPDALFLDVGSGILGGLNADGLSEHIRAHVVPLEIAPTSGVGVVGDAHRLPFQDGSVDGLLIQGVLEHVLDPARIAAEIHRVLKPGAPVYVEIPFIQHYHLDPLDFRRWTLYGLDHEFRAFEKVDSGVCAGPAAGLTDMLTEFPALLFRSPVLYWAVKWVSGWIFSPLQLLDALWAGRERAHIAAAALFYLGRRSR